MTSALPALRAMIPEPIKQRILRPAAALAPLKLLRTAAYHLGWYRFRRTQLNGLHLGCGNLVIPDFLNMDAMISCGCDLAARVDHFKLADNTVSTIYSAHVFEHFDREQSSGVLREWQRVLKPGGTMYLACPDLEPLCQLYLQNINCNTDESKRLTELLTGIFYGGQCYRFNYHYNGWSFPRLKNHLEQAGFTNVRRFDTHKLASWRPFRDASFASVDQTSVSLNIQADKPLHESQPTQEDEADCDSQ